MSRVKFKFFNLIFCTMLILVLSCSKDSTCTPKAFNENIVGSWNIKETFAGSAVVLSESIIFNTDSTVTTTIDFRDDNGNDISSLTYLVVDNILTLEGKGANQTTVTFPSLQLSSNECTKIVLFTTNNAVTWTLTK